MTEEPRGETVFLRDRFVAAMKRQDWLSALKTFEEMADPPGTSVLTLGALKVRVCILETRTVYGRTEVLVEPVAGEGQCWVTEGKVTKR